MSLSEKPLLPDGKHVGPIVEIIYGTDAVPFKTGNGDPLIVLVLEDDAGSGRASRSCPLSKAAERFVYDLLAAVGIDRMALDESGFRVADLAKPEVAGPMLVGKRLAFGVEHRCASRYPTVTIFDRRMMDVLGTEVEDPDADPFEV